MKEFIGKISGAFATGLLWLLLGIRTLLDLIGYATLPDDAKVAEGLVYAFIDWLLTTPTWAFLIAATAPTLLLVWMSRSQSQAIPLHGEPKLVSHDAKRAFLHLEYESNPANSTLIAEENIYRYYNLVTGVAVRVEEDKLREGYLHTLYVVYDQPVTLQNVKINISPNKTIGYEVKDKSDRHCVIVFFRLLNEQNLTLQTY